MSKEKRSPSWSAADIRRYYAGEMTAAEMHALEMAADGDPMLAEAMEGYSSLPSEQWAPVLVDLRRQFTRGPVTHRPGFGFLRAAAGIALIGITIAAAYLLTSRPATNQTELAVNEIKETPVPGNENQPTPVERAVAPPVADPATTPDSNRPLPGAAAATTMSDSSFVYRPAPITTADRVDPEPVQSSTTDDLQTTNLSEVTAINAEPAGNAAMNEVTAGNINPQQAYPANTNDPEIRRQQSARMKSVAETDQLKKAPPGKVMAAETVASPSIGWTAYRQYLEKERRDPEMVRLRKISGEVLLTLSIREDGSITKVDVIRSLHPACDAEAVRLVKEGPSWILTGDKKPVQQQVTIRF